MEPKQAFSWKLPSPEAVDKAVAYFWSKPSAPSILTVIFKIHNPSKRRVRLLLEAHAFVTNMTAAFLKLWIERTDDPRSDGAVAHIVRSIAVDSENPFRSRNVASQLEKQAKSIEQAEKGIFLTDLCQGAYRQCSEMLIGWVLHVLRLSQTKKKRDKGLASLTADEFYDTWKGLEERYRRAMEIVASMNLPINLQHRENQHGLERKSKREARWIRSHLETMDSLQKMVQMVEAILDDDPSATQRQAFITEHLWRTGNKRRMSVRQPWWWQRTFQTPDPKPLLGELSTQDLEQFHDELSEMITYLEFINETIEDEILAGDDHDSPLTTLDARLAYILDTFINRKPSSYPHVEPVGLVPHPQDDRSYRVLRASAITFDEAPEILYQRRLNWFQIDPQRHISVERLLSEERESEEVQGLFAALRLLKPPRLQPIRLNGTARPRHVTMDGKIVYAQSRYFALLYDRKTYELTLALFLHNRPGPGWMDEEIDDQLRRGEEHAEYATRRSNNPLYYVNAPETPFIISKDSTVLLFPLECGKAYHMERFILQGIEQQRQAQHRIADLHREMGRDVPVALCLPKHTSFTSARITCEWNKDSNPQFFAHLTLETPRPERPELPRHVIAVSAYKGTYAYVVMDYAGQIKRASDLHIPRHVDARYGAKRGSRNFIHEVANEIIAMAWLWDAWIAIEDTSRKHERIGVSRAGNRRFIGVPTQTIASTIDYKAKHMGMLPTHRIFNISPRDCPRCYIRRPHEDRPIQIEWFINCPKCDQKIPTDLELKDALCESCSYTWSIEPFTRRSEEIFSCPKCKGEPWFVRWSLALVIAQRALADIVSHQENSEALRMRKKSNSS